MPARALLLPLLLAVALSSLFPIPVLAGNPPLPPAADGRSPAFVTQTDEAIWDDCLWASAAMFIDHWTGGGVRIRHQDLRAASDSVSGGSHLGDLRTAIERLYGWQLTFSPWGGEPLSFEAMLERLAHGGGAIIGGDYSRLPAHLSRWDPAFARSENPSHAVFISRYQPSQQRVWWQDPLGRNGYTGEWVSIDVVSAYIARDATGAVHAAVTPAAPSLDALALDVPRLGRVEHAGGAAEIYWDITDSSARPDLSLTVSWERLADDTIAAPDLPPAAPLLAHAVRLPLEAADLSTGLPSLSLVTTEPPAALVRTLPLGGAVPLSISDDAYRAVIGLPDVPGAYRLTAVLHDRYGQEAAGGRLDTWVLGRYAVSFALPELPELIAGGEYPLDITIANLGATEIGAARPEALPSSVPWSVSRLSAEWVASDGTRQAASAEAGPLVSQLKPEAQQSQSLTLRAPTAPGSYRLEVNLVDSQLGSFSAFGTPPGRADVSVVPVPAVPQPAR